MYPPLWFLIILPALVLVYVLIRKFQSRYLAAQGTVNELRERVHELSNESKSLHELNQRLQSVLDASQETAIIATDKNGRVTLFSRGAERMLGYVENEIVGRNLDLLHLESEIKQRARELAELLNRPLTGLDALLALVRDGGYEIRPWTYVTKAGKNIQVSVTLSAVFDDSGLVKGFLGIAHDITEQVAAEDNLLALNQDLELRVLDRTRELHLATEHLWRTLEDLTLTKDRLVRSEKLAGLGTVVIAVAHELNTPVGVCLTVASTIENNMAAVSQTLESGKMSRKLIADYLSEMREGLALLIGNLQRTANLVVRFKELAVSQSNTQHRKFNLSQIVDLARLSKHPALQGKGFRVEVSLPDDIEMDGYPDAIEQIISSLIENSVVHGFEGRDQGTIRLQCFTENDLVRFNYSDDGLGMSEATRTRVFDPFFTTKFGQGRNGLGMSVCYNLITSLLDGSIDVVNEPGQGCAYVIRLPRCVPLADG